MNFNTKTDSRLNVMTPWFKCKDNVTLMISESTKITSCLLASLSLFFFSPINQVNCVVLICIYLPTESWQNCYKIFS